MAAARHIVLAAGGTGGHVFPARALAEALAARGHRLSLVTDRRGGAFGELAGGIEVHRISAASPSAGAARTLGGLVRLGAGLVQAHTLLRRLAPAAAVGFGGYASVPTMWAAANARIPTLIHEQNAVMGRANRLLAGRVARIATSFPAVARIRPRDRAKVVLTGNPVRAAVAAAGPYAAPGAGAGALRLLVVGGSQGARVMGEVVPAAVAALGETLRRRLRVVQQCRADDLEAVCARYAAAGVTATVATFFDDLPQRLDAAHLVISRAGASAVAELAAAGRPAILVPYPHAADDHQRANAEAAAAAGGAWALPETDFTPAALAGRLAAILDAPAALAEAADRARAFARPDAAERLADAVLALAGAGGNGAGRDGPGAPKERAA